MAVEESRESRAGNLTHEIDRENKHEMTVTDATFLLCTWSTSSSNVMYPYTFGVLGVIGGPLFMILVFIINWICTRLVIRAARETGARTLGELGDYLWGSKGRLLCEGSQIMFQQLFLPVALVLSATSLQSLLAYECNGWAVTILVAIAVLLVQFLAQRLESTLILAYISVGLIIVQTFTIIYSVTNESRDVRRQDKVELIVGMGSDHEDRYSWHSIAGAVGVFIYSCLPNCIVVETMAALPAHDKDSMEGAVDKSFCFYVAIYLLTGIPVVLSWGAEVHNPITLDMKNDWAGVISKLILIYSTMLDFILASITVNRYLIRRHLEPSFDLNMISTSMKGRLHWLRLSTPSMILAASMALLIPRLESLTGLLNSITGTTVQITGISVCLLMAPPGSVISELDTECEEDAINGRENPNKCFKLNNVPLLKSLITFGIILTFLVFSDAVHSMIHTNYSGGNFWCDVVG